MINYRIVANILGLLLLIEGIFMMLPIPVALIYGEHNALSFLVSGLITATAGGVAWGSTRNAIRTISKQEGYIIVTLGWILFSVFGTLPYDLTGEHPFIYGCFFRIHLGLYHHRSIHHE